MCPHPQFSSSSLVLTLGPRLLLILTLGPRLLLVLTLRPHPRPSSSPSALVLVLILRSHPCPLPSPRPRPSTSPSVLTLSPRLRPRPLLTLTLHPCPHPSSSPFILVLVPHPSPQTPLVLVLVLAVVHSPFPSHVHALGRLGPLPLLLDARHNHPRNAFHFWDCEPYFCPPPTLFFRESLFLGTCHPMRWPLSYLLSYITVILVYKSTANMNPQYQPTRVLNPMEPIYTHTRTLWDPYPSAWVWVLCGYGCRLGSGDPWVTHDKH